MGERLKSAVELAMEKYGGSSGGDRNLTTEQKEKIAGIRSFYKAKRAELEILHQQRLKEVHMVDPKEQVALRDKAEEEYRRDRSRMDREEEQKIEDVRQEKKGT